ncbi:MAG: SIR2 family NAD-dependent protein deacylase [Nitrosopumilaceae archaeon]
MGSITFIKDHLSNAERVGVFTGSGVSAESGLDTFRGSGKDSLWLNHRVEDVCTQRGFLRDPILVWRFYNQRREDLKPVTPNNGHNVIAELEAKFENFLLITQNVDSLHSKAGNKKIVELHGNLSRTRCNSCSYVKHDDYEPINIKQIKCPECISLVRPDVVWFEEMLPLESFKKASKFVNEMTNKDIMFIVGTSMEVYPAASIPELAYMRGALIVEINPIKSFYKPDVIHIPLGGSAGMELFKE